jgi:predicted AAA+ superfamily ATPase
VKRYADLLEGLFMIRHLLPWHENLGKRQVKSPRIYFRDPGLLHHLLGIPRYEDLLSHPKCGASWEGYVIEEFLKKENPDEAYFWATHGGAELDLLAVRGGRRIGVEVKRVDAPRMTVSMRTALSDLRLDRLLVFYPGDRRFPLGERVEAVPASELSAPLREMS